MSIGIEAREMNPFVDYVQTEDDSYKWELVVQRDEGQYTQNIIKLTSQKWLTEKEVDRVLWQHWLIVKIPHELSSSVGMLFITGGNNEDDTPHEGSDTTTEIAMTSKAVVAELRMTPNQPLVFHDDGQPRYEDDMIAYAWRHLLDTGDMRWIPRGPMVKGAMRAMDAVTELVQEHTEGQNNIDRFVVAGGSKRGHTTWLTGVMDERVIAIVPIVIDVLNMRASMQNHFASLGFWSPSVGDYVQHGVMQELTDPMTEKLLSIVDPISYTDRLQMPKYVINAAGDQYFLPDSSQFYWDQLEGVKHLRYVPNGDHSLGETDANESLTAFFMLQIAEKNAPEMSWSFDPETKVLHVTSDVAPALALLWSATNPSARDFRVPTFGRNYESEAVQPDEDGTFRVELKEAEQGWTASFVEFTYDLGLPVPFKQTTSAYVLPDMLPFENKPNDLPTSITMICDAPSELGRDVLITQLKNEKSWPFTDGELEFVHQGTRLYINWVPKGRHERGMALIRYLEARNCEPFTYQLESGRNITLPPKTMD